MRKLFNYHLLLSRCRHSPSHPTKSVHLPPNRQTTTTGGSVFLLSIPFAICYVNFEEIFHSSLTALWKFVSYSTKQCDVWRHSMATGNGKGSPNPNERRRCCGRGSVWRCVAECRTNKPAFLIWKINPPPIWGWDEEWLTFGTQCARFEDGSVSGSICFSGIYRLYSFIIHSQSLL